MSPQLLVSGLLALAVLLGSARALWVRTRHRKESRPRAWRTFVLLLAQMASAVLLYYALFPPPIPQEAGTLVVLTAHADQVSAPGAAGDRTVALPEADTNKSSDAERAPDLASALRKYPGTRRLRVLGAGLVARDRDAARGREVEFRPVPLPPGLSELHAPERTPAGRRFAISGRVEALDGGSAELHDPADRRVDHSALDDDGRFELHATSRSAGLTLYRLLLLNSKGKPVDEAILPIEVAPARSLKVLVLAGGPSPELKFLRRWALDAGAELDTRISLGAGMQVGTPRTGFDAATLDRFDLLVLDERSWGALGNGQRGALNAAIDRGLGLLLRVTGPLGGADRNRLAALGFNVGSKTPDRQVRLGGRLVSAGDAADALPTLTRSMSLDAADGIPLLADGAGDPLGFWVSHGRGRVGVSPLVDSFRLVMSGREDVHGEIWSNTFTTLARTSVATASAITFDLAVPYQRSVICGIDDGAYVVSPEGKSVSLHLDPTSGAGRCAGYWATASGWHQVRDDEQTLSFLIPDATETHGMAAHALRQATLKLAAIDPASQTGTLIGHHSSHPGRRWPWFLAWLLLTTASWWLERTRWGHRQAATPDGAGARGTG